MQVGRNLEHLLSTARYWAEERLHVGISATFFRWRTDARYPDPDVESRQDYGSTQGNYMSVSCLHREQNSIFRYFWTTLMSRGTKTSIDVRHEPSMIVGILIGVTRFEWLNKDPPEGHMWVRGRPTKKQVTTRTEYDCRSYWLGTSPQWPVKQTWYEEQFNRQDSSFCNSTGHPSSQDLYLGGKFQKVQMEKVALERRFWEVRRMYGGRCFGVTHDGGKSLGRYFKITQLLWTSKWCLERIHACQNERRTRTSSSFGRGLSNHLGQNTEGKKNTT